MRSQEDDDANIRWRRQGEEELSSWKRDQSGACMPLDYFGLSWHLTGLFIGQLKNLTAKQTCQSWKRGQPVAYVALHYFGLSWHSTGMLVGQLKITSSRPNMYTSCISSWRPQIFGGPVMSHPSYWLRADPGRTTFSFAKMR